MKRCKGFSLVEIAIAMMIIGLLLGSLLMPLSAQLESRHLSDTKKAMDEIREALIGFAIVNGRLPCPATPNTATGAAGAGTENCALQTGVLPWATLGVTETDGWGRRFTYRVTAAFEGTFTLSSAGDNIIKDQSGNNTYTTIPAVIISHGNNGFGAYTTQGTQIGASADADEIENSNGNATFVNHDITTTFDDMVTWISPSVLFNRMVTAGKLP